MAVASSIWNVGDDSAAQENAVPVVVIADIDASVVAVLNAKNWTINKSTKKDKEGDILVDTSCSVNDILYWLKEIRVREDDRNTTCLKTLNLKL